MSLTPHLTVEVPLLQFETGTSISAWCPLIDQDPRAKTVLIMKGRVVLFASRAELAPLLFPNP